MKLLLKPLLKCYLKSLAKLVLFIHRPIIIAIAGSTNKAFAKNVIYSKLKQEGMSVGIGDKNFNTEIGLPLAILRIPESGYNSYRNWLPVIVKAFLALGQKNYPRVLVLEMGISNRGDMKYLLSIIKPQIAVITDINQRYLEAFSGMDRLVGEYKLLVKKVDATGLVVLNYDNSRTRRLAKLTKSKVITFGEKKGADYQVELIERITTGEKFQLKILDKDKKLEIKSFGRHNVYAETIGLIINDYFNYGQYNRKT